MVFRPTSLLGAGLASRVDLGCYQKKYSLEVPRPSLKRSVTYQAVSGLFVVVLLKTVHRISKTLALCEISLQRPHPADASRAASAGGLSEHGWAYSTPRKAELGGEQLYSPDEHCWSFAA